MIFKLNQNFYYFVLMFWILPVFFALTQIPFLAVAQDISKYYETSDVVWSPIGDKFLVSRGNSQTIRIVDSITGKVLNEIPTSYGHNPEIWSPDGQRLLVYNQQDSSKMEIWEMPWASEIKAPLVILENGTDYGAVTSAVWNSDGTMLLLTTIKGDAHIWDAVNFEKISIFSVGVGLISDSDWSPAGDKVVIADASGDMNIIDIYNPDNKIRFLLPMAINSQGGFITPQANDVEWSPSGEYIALGGQDGIIRILAFEKLNSEEILANNLIDNFTNKSFNMVMSQGINDLAWSPDGSLIAASDQSEDGHIKIWDAYTGELIIDRTFDATVIRSIAWKPNSKELTFGAISEDAHYLFESLSIPSS